MRRIALLTSSCLLLLIASSCRDDGRTLRPPKAEQDATISVVIPSTDVAPVFDDPDVTDPLLPDESSAPTDSDDTDTFPANVTQYVAIAPWRDGAVGIYEGSQADPRSGVGLCESNEGRGAEVQNRR